MNQEFQELKCQFACNVEKCIAPIVEKMRENLIKRNKRMDLYKFPYTEREKIVSIGACKVDGLINIDKNMQPPLDQEFQNLLGEYIKRKEDYQDPIVAKMRDNLTKRNGNNDEYTFQYASHETINISTVDIDGMNGLFAIDGDMNHYGQ